MVYDDGGDAVFAVWDWTARHLGEEIENLVRPFDSVHIHRGSAFWPQTSLPPLVREKIALLRLARDGAKLEGIGERVSEAVFFLENVEI